MRLRGVTVLPIRGLGHLIVALFLLNPPDVLEDGFCELLLYGFLGSKRSPGLLSPLLRPGPESRGTAALRVAER